MVVSPMEKVIANIVIKKNIKEMESYIEKWCFSNRLTYVESVQLLRTFGSHKTPISELSIAAEDLLLEFKIVWKMFIDIVIGSSIVFINISDANDRTEFSYEKFSYCVTKIGYRVPGILYGNNLGKLDPDLPLFFSRAITMYYGKHFKSIQFVFNVYSSIISSHNCSR